MVYFLVLIVPGYMTLSVANTITPGLSESAVHQVLRCISVGLVINLVVPATSYVTSIEIKSFAVRIAALMFLAVVTGLLVGFARRWGLLRKVMHKLGLNVSSAPTFWDFKFAQINTGAWICAVLNDGDAVYGLYSNDSFASSIADAQAGIFLERQTDKDWKCLPSTDGVLIPYSSIRYIKFYNEEVGNVCEAGEENQLDSGASD